MTNIKYEKIQQGNLLGADVIPGVRLLAQIPTLALHDLNHDDNDNNYNDADDDDDNGDDAGDDDGPGDGSDGSEYLACCIWSKHPACPASIGIASCCKEEYCLWINMFRKIFSAKYI